MKAAEIIKSVREEYENTKRESDELFEKFISGSIDATTWKFRDAELSGMRQAYAAVLGMVGATTC